MKIRTIYILGIVSILTIIFLRFTGISFAKESKGGNREIAGESLKAYEPTKGQNISAFMVERIIGSACIPASHNKTLLKKFSIQTPSGKSLER